jgi:hypothetical protein
MLICWQLYTGDEFIGLIALLHSILLYRTGCCAHLNGSASYWSKATLQIATDIFTAILIQSHSDVGVSESLAHVYSNLYDNPLARYHIDSLAAEVLLSSKLITQCKVCYG